MKKLILKSVVTMMMFITMTSLSNVFGQTYQIFVCYKDTNDFFVYTRIGDVTSNEYANDDTITKIFYNYLLNKNDSSDYVGVGTPTIYESGVDRSKYAFKNNLWIAKIVKHNGVNKIALIEKANNKIHYYITSKDNKLSINKSNNIENFNIYPNPVNDILNVNFNSDKDVNISITNLNGRIHPTNYTSKVPGNKSCNLLQG